MRARLIQVAIGVVALAIPFAATTGVRMAEAHSGDITAGCVEGHPTITANLKHYAGTNEISIIADGVELVPGGEFNNEFVHTFDLGRTDLAHTVTYFMNPVYAQHPIPLTYVVIPACYDVVETTAPSTTETPTTVEVTTTTEAATTVPETTAPEVTTTTAAATTTETPTTIAETTTTVAAPKLGIPNPTTTAPELTVPQDTGALPVTGANPTTDALWATLILGLGMFLYTIRRLARRP